MAVIKPFAGIRPAAELAPRVAAPPYDVLSSSEARKMAVNNPVSFLHINKPEIDLDPKVDPHDESVYRKGAENLQDFISRGILSRDEVPRYYVYRQIMGSHEQTGLVAVASVEEYEHNIIKKHELTRPDKEDDRVHHMDALNAQVGPVFLTYRSENEINGLIGRCTAADPVYDFAANDGIRHIFWIVEGTDLLQSIEAAFLDIPCLYVADGHHRSAAALRVKAIRQAANPGHSGSEPYNYFLVVLFPHDQMQILDYNRAVTDLNGLSQEDFLHRLEDAFEVSPRDCAATGKPSQAHSFGMYLCGQWYSLATRAKSMDDNDPVSRLDVSILQNNVLSPILGIHDPRTDSRLEFIGGIRGMEELERRVNSGEYAVAFACFPTSVENLMDIADAGKIMPPKSTWFEPKLKSGLVVHVLD